MRLECPLWVEGGHLVRRSQHLKYMQVTLARERAVEMSAKCQTQTQHRGGTVPLSLSGQRLFGCTGATAQTRNVLIHTPLEPIWSRFITVTVGRLALGLGIEATSRTFFCCLGGNG